MLSEEGLRVVREIVAREEHRWSFSALSTSASTPAPTPTFSVQSSILGPWLQESSEGTLLLLPLHQVQGVDDDLSTAILRDLQNCSELLALFARVVGQPVLPHFCFSNSPQVRDGKEVKD